MWGQTSQFGRTTLTEDLFTGRGRAKPVVTPWGDRAVEVAGSNDTFFSRPASLVLSLSGIRRRIKGWLTAVDERLDATIVGEDPHTLCFVPNSEFDHLLDDVAWDRFQGYFPLARRMRPRQIVLDFGSLGAWEVRAPLTLPSEFARAVHLSGTCLDGVLVERFRGRYLAMKQLSSEDFVVLGANPKVRLLGATGYDRTIFDDYQQALAAGPPSEAYGPERYARD